MSLLKVTNLKTTFYSRSSKIPAVRGVSISIEKGDILGLVGESGSGKSITMKSIMGIIPPNAKVDSGEIIFNGVNLAKLSENGMRKYRGKEIAMIFQDPMTALNPLRTIGYHLTEVIMRHKNIPKANANKEAIEALKMVGIPSPEKRLSQYPHEFSGGMRQRVMIAMAISCNPKLLIADEPTTALDVTIQAQILMLIKDLQKKIGMSVVLITHDLGVVASICNRIAVMYGGMIMEEGLTDEIFYSPQHPYTRALLKSIPRLDVDEKTRLKSIRGNAPSGTNIPKGCPFYGRCEESADKCASILPDIQQISATRKVRCIFNGGAN